MSLTDNESIKLFKWSEKHNSITTDENIFTKCDITQESYFSLKSNKNLIEEYSFETPNELNNKLSDLWKENDMKKEIITVISVATFKRKPVMNAENENNSIVEEFDLPNFIYVF